jgi:uroporphyrinogen decarboxylase
MTETHEKKPAWKDSPMYRAARGLPTDRVPVWLMRQAGRYMSEYREVRARTTFLDLCRNARLSAEVMITAVEKLNVDAAIIFSDLLPMLIPMGLDLEYQQGEGPVLHNPIRSPDDVARLRQLDDVGELDFVFETVRLTREGIDEAIPVIGFSGCPFTLAGYAIEGGGSKNFLHTKTFMYTQPDAWKQLLEKIARTAARYLNAQIDAGAQIVQVFDSWVGCLSVDDYRRFVLPFSKMLIDSITPGVPVIHFGTGNPQLLPLFRDAGGDVIGVDWRIPLDEAWETVGHDRAVQGNLDPAVLLTNPETIEREVAIILEKTSGRPGHIFNLGHGVMKQTPVENAVALVEAVHRLGKKPS